MVDSIGQWNLHDTIDPQAPGGLLLLICVCVYMKCECVYMSWYLCTCKCDVAIWACRKRVVLKPRGRQENQQQLHVAGRRMVSGFAVGIKA